MKGNSHHISALFVDDQAWNMSHLIASFIRKLNTFVSVASTLGTVIERLKENQFDIII